MTKAQIIALFPIKAEITQDIINKGSIDVYNSRVCKGATALKSVLPKELEWRIRWGVTDGGIELGETNEEGVTQYVVITTEDRTDIMNLDEPKTVVFITDLNEYL